MQCLSHQRCTCEVQKSSVVCITANFLGIAPLQHYTVIHVILPCNCNVKLFQTCKLHLHYNYVTPLRVKHQSVTVICGPRYELQPRRSSQAPCGPQPRRARLGLLVKRVKPRSQRQVTNGPTPKRSTREGVIIKRVTSSTAIVT